jgi:O-antigen/teichoic acid export membrane protein
MTPKPISSKAPSLGAQASRAVLWNVLFVPLRMLAEVTAQLLKLSWLSQASFGILSLLNSTNNGLGTWIDLGTGRALPKFIPEVLRSAGPRAVLRLLVAALGAQIGLLLIIGAVLVALRDRGVSYLSGLVSGAKNLPAADRQHVIQFIGEWRWPLIGAILAVLLFGIFYDVLMAYLSSFFKQRAWNSVNLAAQLLPPLLTVAVILAGFDIAGIVAVMVLAPAIATALVGWQVLRHQREIAALPAAPDDRRWVPAGFVRYCAVSFLMTSTDFLASGGFALFFASDVVQAALLAAGVNVVRMVLGYLYTPMVGLQVPLFTRVRQGEGGTLLGAYQSLARLQVLLLLPGGIGLLLLARPIFTLLNPEYISATALVWVLVPCLFLESLLTTAHNALIVYERLRMVVIARLLTLVCVPLVIVLTPLFGIVGAALAFGLARVLAGVWVTANGYRLLGLRWPWRFTMRVLLASGVMAAVVGGLSTLIPAVDVAARGLQRLWILPPLLLISGIGGALFLALLRLLGGLDDRDRQQIAQMRLPLKRWLLRML